MLVHFLNGLAHVGGHQPELGVLILKHHKKLVDKALTHPFDFREVYFRFLISAQDGVVQQFPNVKHVMIHVNPGVEAPV